MNKKNSEKMEVLLWPSSVLKLNEGRTLKKSYPVKLEKAEIKLMVDDWVQHYKKDKWPLSLDWLQSELFWNMFGIDSTTFIALLLKEQGIEVGIGFKQSTGEMLFVKKPLTKKAKTTAQKRKRKK